MSVIRTQQFVLNAEVQNFYTFFDAHDIVPMRQCQSLTLETRVWKTNNEIGRGGCGIDLHDELLAEKEVRVLLQDGVNLRVNVGRCKWRLTSEKGSIWQKQTV